MKQFNKSFFSSFSFRWQKIVALLGRNTRRPLAKIIENMIILMGGHKTTSTTKGVYHLLTILHRVLKTQGPVGLVKYTKALTVILQQSIAGYRIGDLSSIGPRVARTRKGLPAVLPLIWRREIRRGNTFYMKLSLSISNIYRVVEYKGSLKTGTITDLCNMPDSVLEYLKGFMGYFAKLTAKTFKQVLALDPKGGGLVLQMANKTKAFLVKNFLVFPIFTSGPTVIRKNRFSNWSSSNYSITRALHSLMARPLLKEAVFQFMILYDLIPDQNFFGRGKTHHYPKLRAMWEQHWKVWLTQSWWNSDNIEPSFRRNEIIHSRERERAEIIAVTEDHVHTFGPFELKDPKILGHNPKEFGNRLFITINGIVREIFGGTKVTNGGVTTYSLNVAVPKETSVGKLGLKDEPAGKVRVFAMVDPITQWLMRPIHRLLFNLLKAIPMDGTFNQMKPISRLLQNGKTAGLYSFDLSAATDRLPVKIQEHLLAQILGEKLAFQWKTLLVNRAYTLKGASLYYGTGQPMGALSSWAMLAWTHHFLVQVAAWRVGMSKSKLFMDYAVLGDDIVIANHRVAKSYLHIMKIIDVPINLSKSVVSRHSIGLEFAKRTLYRGVDISPIPFREFSEASLNLTTFIELVKKYKLPFSKVLKLMGYGYKVLGQSDLHASMMKGRYKWVKVLMTFPTSSEELRSWVVSSVSESLLWSCIGLEYIRLEQLVSKMHSWSAYVWAEGFLPLRNNIRRASWAPRFHSLQSRTVSLRVLRTVEDIERNLSSLRFELQAMEIGAERDPWVAFSNVLQLYTDITLLSSQPKDRNADETARRKFYRMRNRNNQLYMRWINHMRPPMKSKRNVHVQCNSLVLFKPKHIVIRPTYAISVYS